MSSQSLPEKEALGFDVQVQDRVAASSGTPSGSYRGKAGQSVCPPAGFRQLRTRADGGQEATEWRDTLPLASAWITTASTTGATMSDLDAEYRRITKAMDKCLTAAEDRAESCRHTIEAVWQEMTVQLKCKFGMEPTCLFLRINPSGSSKCVLPDHLKIPQI